MVTKTYLSSSLCGSSHSSNSSDSSKSSDISYSSYSSDNSDQKTFVHHFFDKQTKNC